MIGEVSLSSFDYDELERNDKLSSTPSASNIHTAIFAPQTESRPFVHKAILAQCLSETETKAGRVASEGNISYRVKSTKRTIEGDVKAKQDTDGNTTATGEVQVNVRDDNGNKASITASGGAKRDRDGNVSGEVEVQLKVEREF